MMGIGVACGQGRLFPVCVSVYRRVCLERDLFGKSYSMQIKHWKSSESPQSVLKCSVPDLHVRLIFTLLDSLLWGVLL